MYPAGMGSSDGLLVGYGVVKSPTSRIVGMTMIWIVGCIRLDDCPLGVRVGVR
jgi:hypothetical protein